MGMQVMLRENDLKVTPQRMAILQHLEKMGHATVDEIYSSVREQFPSVSLGTVYKNITDMSELNIISEVKIPRQKQRYEITKKPHIHLVCERCGEICDFEINTDAIVSEAERSSGYSIKDRSATLVGICPKCNA